MIEPGSPEWLRLITPSKVAAIAGASRYESPYSLWCRMKGWTDPQAPADRFDVGHAYEWAARELWKVDPRNEGWRISQRGVQIATEQFGFPAVCTLDRRASRGKARRVVEFKITGSIEDWGADPYHDEPTPPWDFVVQTTMQMAMTGWTKYPAHLMVLGPRIHQRHIYEVEFRPAMSDSLIELCQGFWRSLAGSTPPDLDEHVATYECIREQHPDIVKCVHTLDGDGKPTVCTGVEVPGDLVKDLRGTKQRLEQEKTAERGLKTRLLDILGDNQHARVGNVVVADRRPHASGSVALNVNNREF
jgi:YqaJ-like viral recombinase domain